MDKLDLKKTYKALYSAKSDPAFITVPPLNCLMIDGAGDPNVSKEFSEAMEALYTLSYTLKFAFKKAGRGDWTVMGPEGLWWSERMEDFSSGNKKDWKWRLFIVQPDFLTRDDFGEAVEAAAKKKECPALSRLRLERFEEGLAAQYLHIGSYDSEGPGISRLHEFIKSNGRELHGLHHEIYLSDTRKAPQEKWKTIIRQPCR